MIRLTSRTRMHTTEQVEATLREALGIVDMLAVEGIVVDRDRPTVLTEAIKLVAHHHITLEEVMIGGATELPHL